MGPLLAIKLVTRVFVVVVMCSASLALATSSITPDKDPFWKKKTKYYKRIKDKREILVSVRTLEIDKKKEGASRRLKMVGAGHVNAPLALSHKTVKDFDSWKKISDHIVESRYREKRKELFLHSEAFGYHARMLIKVEFTQPQKGTQWMHFRIIGGTLRGLRGVLALTDYERQKTEISMTAIYDFDKLPIPGFFAKFGLEVVLQKMAAGLRTHIENQKPRGL